MLGVLPGIMLGVLPGSCWVYYLPTMLGIPPPGYVHLSHLPGTPLRPWWARPRYTAAWSSKAYRARGRCYRSEH